MCTFPFFQWAGAQRALPHPELAVMSAETPGPPPTSARALPCPANPTLTWTSSGLLEDAAPTCLPAKRRGAGPCWWPLPALAGL